MVLACSILTSGRRFHRVLIKTGFAASWLLLMLAFATNASAQVKIGDNETSIEPSSLLELESTTKGLLLPRMTEAQRDAVSAAVSFVSGNSHGLTVYNVTEGCINWWNHSESAWISPCSNEDSITNDHDFYTYTKGSNTRTTLIPMTITDDLWTEGAIVWGAQSNSSSGANSGVMGSGNTNTAANALVAGSSNTVSGSNSAAWGLNDTVSGAQAAAWGSSNTVSGANSAAWGSSNIVSGASSMASGGSNLVSGSFSVSGGRDNSVTGTNTLVVGHDNTVARNQNAVFGYQNSISNGDNNLVSGNGNTLSGGSGMAIGQGNIVFSNNAMVIGNTDTAYGGNNGA